MTATRAAYSELRNIFTRHGHLEHALKLMQWDTMVMLPPGSHESRKQETVDIKLAVHETLTNPRLPGIFASIAAGSSTAAAAGGGLSVEETASVREMRRTHAMVTSVDPALVERKTIATAECYEAWLKCRPANDFEGFLPYFESVISATREEGKQLGKGAGLGAYDALLDTFEPGMTSALLTRHFGELSEWLPHAVKYVAGQKQPRIVAAGGGPVVPRGPFPAASQRALVERMMAVLGLDMERTRLDISPHPFCGGVPSDTRITFRTTENDFADSLMAGIHESGHARYEQHLPVEWLHNPVGTARSNAIHESQSLLAEMQQARSLAFLRFLSPLLAEAYPSTTAAQPGVFEASNLARIFSWVEPGKIRVSADEMCYPLHVALRFEIERGLVDGSLSPADVPHVWARKMKEYLDVDVDGDHTDGCMQDVHWPMGLIGYFPCYTLGAMYAAQINVALRRDVGGAVVDDCLSSGSHEPITGWLDRKVWSHGSLLETDELLRQATGEPFNAVHFKNHLMERYVA